MKLLGLKPHKAGAEEGFFRVRAVHRLRDVQVEWVLVEKHTRAQREPRRDPMPNIEVGRRQFDGERLGDDGNSKQLMNPLE